MMFQKIDAALQTVVTTQSQHQNLECIVKAADYKRLRTYLHTKNIEVLHEYLFIHSFRVRVSKAQLYSLSNLSQVEFIYSVASATALMHVAKKILQVDHLQYTGENVTIAFIDTGVYPHFDFLLGKDRIVLFQDFIAGKQKPYDDNGHGSFVTGVCAGSGARSGGKFSGVAPKANIISLKALNASGEASADKILDAMEWVFDHADQYHIQVVCMSFGSEPLGYNDPIMSGSEALWKKGIVVVAAAGNSGPEYQTIKSPGVSSQIITVGGFDDNRLDSEAFDEHFFEMADFSSRGPAFQRYKPDLVAPSVDIVSCGIKSPYTMLSGTSVATPMVAGLAALILEKEHNLSPDDVKLKLLSCCKSISFNRNVEGYGYPILKI